MLLGLAAIDIGFGNYFPFLGSLNAIDPVSILFILIYLLAMRLIYEYEKVRLNEVAGELAEKTDADEAMHGAVFGDSGNFARQRVRSALSAFC